MGIASAASPKSNPDFLGTDFCDCQFRTVSLGLDFCYCQLRIVSLGTDFCDYQRRNVSLGALVACHPTTIPYTMRLN